MKNTPQQFTLESFHNLIGIPYKTLDCYGLVVKFYGQVFNHELEILYKDRPSPSETKELVEMTKRNFEKVTTPKFGDIVVFNVKGLPCHIGIFINQKIFLHTMKKIDCVIDRLDRWDKRVVGYYRCPELNLD